MTLPRSTTSRIRMLALLALAASALSACTPTPEPTPTPTAAFASEEEAFAAAEEVYREYNDAVNAQRKDEDSRDPQSHLTALALESDIDANRILEENGVHIEGDGKITSFEGVSWTTTTTPETISAEVCLDVSQTRVVDEEGTDHTPATRADEVALVIELVASPGSLLISSSAEGAASRC